MLFRGRERFSRASCSRDATVCAAAPSVSKETSRPGRSIDDAAAVVILERSYRSPSSLLLPCLYPPRFRERTEPERPSSHISPQHMPNTRPPPPSSPGGRVRGLQLRHVGPRGCEGFGSFCSGGVGGKARGGTVAAFPRGGPQHLVHRQDDPRADPRAVDGGDAPLQPSALRRTGGALLLVQFFFVFLSAVQIKLVVRKRVPAGGWLLQRCLFLRRTQKA